MFRSLKNHPFAVEAFFKSSIVLTFAIPKEKLKDQIPECLELDTFDDKWAFLAVAMVDTKDLRPKGFPKIMGNNFFLMGYRVFVRYTDIRGRSLRGLYILKSETNKNKMKFFGNVFTHYNYSTIDVSLIEDKKEKEIMSSTSGFHLKVGSLKKEVFLPENSPFPNWKIARRFAGPMPFTFTFNPDTNEVLIIEGVRENWNPKPLKVIDYNFPFLKKLNVSESVLANAFIINDVPYYWKKGRKELWKK